MKSLGSRFHDSSDGLHEKHQPQQRHGFDDAHDHDEHPEALASLAHRIGGHDVVTAAELTACASSVRGEPGEIKIADREQARRIVEGWRARGLKVGFTNGCFDLLHPGHVSLLSQAKAACDRLIVGLNTDASVSKLKGPTRPVQKEQGRATVLASLSSPKNLT